MALPPGFEPRFAASETAALSIELWELTQGSLAFAGRWRRQLRKSMTAKVSLLFQWEQPSSLYEH